MTGTARPFGLSANHVGVTVSEVLIPEEQDTVERRLIRRFLERLPLHRMEEVIFRLMRDFGHEEALRRRRIALIGLRGVFHRHMPRGAATVGALRWGRCC